MQHIGKDKEPMQILEPALLKSTDGHTSDQAHREGESAISPMDEDVSRSMVTERKPSDPFPGPGMGLFQPQGVPTSSLHT